MHDRKSQGPLIHDGDHCMRSVVRHSISLSELDLLGYILVSTQYSDSRSRVRSTLGLTLAVTGTRTVESATASRVVIYYVLLLVLVILIVISQ